MVGPSLGVLPTMYIYCSAEPDYNVVRSPRRCNASFPVSFHSLSSSKNPCGPPIVNFSLLAHLDAARRPCMAAVTDSCSTQSFPTILNPRVSFSSLSAPRSPLPLPPLQPSPALAPPIKDATTTMLEAGACSPCCSLLPGSTASASTQAA